MRPPRPSAPVDPVLPRAARAHQPHLQHRLLDDGADIEAIALPHPWIGDAPAAVLVLLDAREALIGFQRIAAGGDEIDHVVEIGPRQVRIGRRGQHFVIELVGQKRLAAGAAEHVLRQHVERAGAQRRGVLRVLGDRVDRDAAFQHLEAIGRHQHRARGFVDAVIGAADPLHQPRRALRRADIDDEIDVAPVDAEIERRGADHAAQFAGRHRVLDLAALRDVERAVMQRDGEAVVVHAPQVLEQHLGLAAGVDEHQRGLVALDQVVDLAQRVARAMAGPGQPLSGVEHLDDRRARRRRRSRDRRHRCCRRAAAPETAPAIPARRPWPTARSRACCGASRHSRASPSDSRSPRLEVTSACSSSSTMRLSDENRNGASSDDSSSASCSGVVSRISGG